MTRLLKFLEPGYIPPSRKHLSKLLKERYEKVVSSLKAKLTGVGYHISLTSNIYRQVT